jgi:hypothetical protein
MRSRARVVALLLAALVLSGCEEHQAAVPLARSLPMALLQLAVVSLVVVGGSVVFRRMAVARGAAQLRPHTVRRILAVYPAAVAGGLLAWVLLWIATVALGYREPTYQLFSWSDSVVIAWISVASCAPLALLHLRMAAALWHGRRWADVVLGVQAGVALVWGLAAQAA